MFKHHKGLQFEVKVDRPDPMGQAPKPAVPPPSLHHDIDMP